MAIPIPIRFRNWPMLILILKIEEEKTFKNSFRKFLNTLHSMIIRNLNTLHPLIIPKQKILNTLHSMIINSYSEIFSPAPRASSTILEPHFHFLKIENGF